MKAIKFRGSNVTITNQEGEKVPAYIGNDSIATLVVGYKLSFKERIYILFFGKIWFSQATNNARIKVFRITVNKYEVLRKVKSNTDDLSTEKNKK